MWSGFCSAISLGLFASESSAVEVTRPTRLDWNLKTLVEAYQKAGHTNPKWDKPAKSEAPKAATKRPTANRGFTIFIVFLGGGA